jgi:hypothetical protein
MNDQTTKWLRLLFFAILFHAVLSFASNFHIYELQGARASTTFFSCIRLNRITGSVDHIAYSVPQQTMSPRIVVPQKVEPKKFEYDFGDIIEH